MGTKLWPSLEDWKGKILLIETSDNEGMLPVVKYILQNLEAEGILDVLSGILIGRHPYENEIEDLKNLVCQVVLQNGKHFNLPIIYNVNVGHAEPIGVFALGCKYEIDCDNKKLTLIEKATV